MNTKHAQIRAQQRAIPPLAVRLLDEYGREMHAGGGTVITFLDRAAIRRIEQDYGRRPAAKLTEWFDVYRVSTTTGTTLTIGHRTRRLRRK